MIHSLCDLKNEYLICVNCISMYQNLYPTSRKKDERTDKVRDVQNFKNKGKIPWNAAVFNFINLRGVWAIQTKNTHSAAHRFNEVKYESN